jgi:hypothetical protein
VVPPAGELGLLRPRAKDADASPAPPPALASLASHLPPGSIVLIASPTSLAGHALRLEEQVKEGDPFHARWEDFQRDVQDAGHTLVRLEDADPAAPDSEDPLRIDGLDAFWKASGIELSAGTSLREAFEDGADQPGFLDALVAEIDAARPLVLAVLPGGPRRGSSGCKRPMMYCDSNATL